MTDKTAVMICGHGSRDGDAIRQFEQVAAGLAERSSTMIRAAAKFVNNSN